jgi:LPS sulfotransferase NodH
MRNNALSTTLVEPEEGLAAVRAGREPSAKLLLIVAHPRSGSNRLVEALASFGKVAAFAEAFHPDQCFAEDDHERDFASFVENVHGPLHGDPVRALASWVRADADRAVTAMRAYGDHIGRSLVAVKLFHFQLKPHELLYMIFKHDPIALILRRQPIHAFISMGKAEAIGQWTSVDTTGLLGRINYANYAGWYTWNEDFLRLAYAALELRRCYFEVKDYEELFAGARPVEAQVADFFARAAVDPGEHTPRPPRLFRQDRSERAADKVANWDEFLHQASVSTGPRIDDVFLRGVDRAPVLRARGGN